MENQLQYRSTIKSRPFFFLETKKAAELLHTGSTEKEVKEKVLQENLFQVDTEARKREMASIVISRLKVLDTYLISRVVHGDIESGKLIALYAIMKTDRLFFEFMNEVLKEKFILREHVLTDKDFNIFFDNKKQQSEVVASWKDYTFYKLRQVYIRILFEAGFLKNQKGERELARPMMEGVVIEHMKSLGEHGYVEILAGEAV